MSEVDTTTERHVEYCSATYSGRGCHLAAHHASDPAWDGTHRFTRDLRKVDTEVHAGAVPRTSDEYRKELGLPSLAVEPPVPPISLTDAALREELAALCHDQWAGWMRYLFDQTITVGDDCEEIQTSDVKRWMRQIQTPYVELPDNEKESDRKEADKILAVLAATTPDLATAARAAAREIQKMVTSAQDAMVTLDDQQLANIIIAHLSPVLRRVVCGNCNAELTNANRSLSEPDRC